MIPQKTAMVAITLIAGSLNNLRAEDHSDVREGWRQRLDQHEGVAYLASVTTKSIGQPASKSTGVETHVAALMRCDQRKFRFDVKPASQRFSALHVLDKKGFHQSTQMAADTWVTNTQTALADDSSWLLVYPFLLAHGVVPLPPLEAPKFSPRRRNESPARAGLGAKRVTFEFAGKDPVAVHIVHNSHGLVERYDAIIGGRKLLEIRNQYRREKDAVRFDKYTVWRYNSQGKLVAHLEGQVTKFQPDAIIPLATFAPPRAPDELRADLLKALEKKVLVKADASLADVAQSVQAALGDDLQVRIEDEAFLKGPPRALVDINRLNVRPGESPLSQLLLRDLRGIRVDFYLDAQGIVLIPRNEAWNHALSTGYSAKDFGLTQDELHKAIYSAGTHDDWSDVGGPALILAADDGDTVMVMHTQSDHVRFEERLRKRGD